MLISPFLKTDKNRLKNRIIILFVLLILSILLLKYLNTFLINNIAANGIVTFELAKEVSFSKSIINSWDAIATAAAGYSLIFDFFFMAVYSLFLALLVHYTNEKVWKKGAVYKIGIVLIYAQFLAAIFDAIENISLLQLFKNATQFWTSMAYYFASMKFVLIFIGLLFIVISWVVKVFKR